MNITNVNKRQFDNVMQREGKDIYDYYDTSKVYQVFFRRNNRSNSPQGKLRMFYPQDCGLGMGTVFTLKDEPYVIISQDGIESDVYYTSLAVKCDTFFTINANGKFYQIPFVVASDKFTVSRGQSISVTSGSVSIFTGLNDIVKNMEVNDYYENFGNAYVVGNTFTNNNIYYVYLEQEGKRSDTYQLVYNGESTLNMTEATTYQLTYTALQNNTIVESPALTYTSTDETVATVDATGLMTMLKEGSTTVNATWTEQGISCSTDFTIVTSVSPEPTEPTNTYTITGGTTIRVGRSKSWTCKVVDADNNAVYGDMVTWNVICDYEVTQTITEATSESYAKIALVVDDENAIANTIMLQALVDDSVVATLEITIQEAY